MDLCESGQLTPEQESAHWWIQTRFLYLEDALASAHRSLPDTGRGLKVLEMGCGTAQNLHYLRTQSPRKQFIEHAIGVDPALTPAQLETVSQSRWLLPQDKITRTLDPALIPESGFDLLIAMDVLEHINEDRAALGEWLNAVRPGGTVFLTVPAFQSLWSYHDEILKHKRRYTRQSLLKTTETTGLEPRSIKYAFSYAFLPVVALRKLAPSRSNGRPETTDLRLPSPLVNLTMKTLGKLEHALGGNPFLGTSVLGVFRKGTN